MTAKLVLEDGSCFEGVSIGATGRYVGDVILNTGIVGYQQNITDPANAGKILIQTYPVIGSTGVAEKFALSSRPWAAAVIIKELSRVASNYQTEGEFQDYLAERGVICLSGVDTRAVAVAIRDNGEQAGVVSTDEADADELLKHIKSEKDSTPRDWISQVGVREPTKICSGSTSVAVVDLGVRADLLSQLESQDMAVTLLPCNIPAEEILQGGYEAAVFSSGPEEDDAIEPLAAEAAKLLGKIPTLGIGVGHEVLSVAAGGKTSRLPLGHRGMNYPVRSPQSWRGEITVQNHRRIVEPESLGDDVTVTLINVNDETVEEIASGKLRMLSTHTIPAPPGPGEVHHVFRRFAGMVCNQEDPTCPSAPTSTKS